MRAEVLTYSRARGVFAGITVNGAVISQHKDDTRAFYGRMVPFRTILSGNIAAPPDAESFLTTVAKYTGTYRPSPASTTAPGPAASTTGSN
jgi:lipid-binding SYLF domain-containing protein